MLCCEPEDALTFSFCPALILLLVSPFKDLSSETLIPCLAAIPDNVSPLFTEYVPDAEVLAADDVVDG